MNARSITGSFAELTANLNFIREPFSFIIIVEYRLTDQSNLVLELDGYKSHMMNRLGRTLGGTKLLRPDYISTELINKVSVIEVSFESVFVQAAVPSLGNMFVAEIY